MRLYAINISERRRMAFLFVILAVLLSIPENEFSFTFPSFLMAFGLYAVLYSLFARFVWKWKWARKVFSIETPNLNGNWEVTLKNKKEKHTYNIRTVIAIKQEWDRMEVLLEDKLTLTKNTHTLLKKNEDGDFELTFYYETDSKDEEKWKRKSSGIAKFTFDIKENTLKGNYFVQNKDEKENRSFFKEKIM